MVKDKAKLTTTIDIDKLVLAEFSYLVTIKEKTRKRNEVIEDMMKSYNDKNRK